MSKDRITAIANKLKERHLKYPQDLELFDDRLVVRNVEEIAKRAIVSIIVSKCAFELSETESLKIVQKRRPDMIEKYGLEFEIKDIKKVKEECIEILKRFGLDNELFSDERAVLYDAFDEELCIDIYWKYEAVIALLWALGMIENLDDAEEPDYAEEPGYLLNGVFEKVTKYLSLDDFLKDCVLRCEEELADMFQLYWHYHWNTVDGMIFGTMPESISFDVVYERRRALQWLVYSDESNEGDWDFVMNT